MQKNTDSAHALKDLVTKYKCTDFGSLSYILYNILVLKFHHHPQGWKKYYRITGPLWKG